MAFECYKYDFVWIVLEMIVMDTVQSMRVQFSYFVVGMITQCKLAHTKP